ncbi:MAG: gluconate:H+ symporter [Bacteroidota bacterium]|jgi:Gnt-I system high-affinity gluconate transporter|nr:gluconate permease [Cytophagales bacterium]MCE2955752.1 gluconate:H+ symporter [Flammeovirgaceae bacterium]MCZ8070613.1 gluconate:H+ symporter [Cytophagales bacterium]
MPLLIVAVGVLVLLGLILLKVKPIYALLIAAVAVGLLQGLTPLHTLQSIGNGIVDTLKSIAVILCLGAMLGKMIEVSGAAQQITHTLIGWFGRQNLHWAVMLTGLVVGIPLFYNAGFVILIPLVFSIASSAGVPILRVGIPMAASLSVTHGFLPPHPGPTAIAAIFHADLNKTLLYGLMVTVPTVILAGPIFSKSLSYLKVIVPKRDAAKGQTVMPPVALSFIIALFPVGLIAVSGVATYLLPSVPVVVTALGTPTVALALALLLAVYFFGVRQGMALLTISRQVYLSIKDIALILLVIAAGGGFKQVLIDSGVGEYIKQVTAQVTFSPLILAWGITALLRVSLGSATVAALTASGIVLPLVATSGVAPELMVLAVGAGSLFFSHVNDTGFWMFKEYFNLSLKQTFLSWTLMESIVSVVGLAAVLLLERII